MRTAHCLRCNQVIDGKLMEKAIEELRVLRCEVCEGLVRPDTVFFGEMLPEVFLKSINQIKKADLVIVMGTSL